ncbi:MAG: hypothetical protein ACOYNY_08630 [Caldilineaceae bacterium]
MNSALTVLWSLAIASGLFLGYRVLHRVLHLVVIGFGVETTALVRNAHRSEKDGNVYLQGDYVFTDARGREHTFAFTICADWPGDAQWRKIMHFYTRGQRNRVRYLPWLPSLHEVQTTA